MHKITKGLKKKKKTKKHKKEDDLFDEVELEKYRRAHQQESEGGQQEEQVEQGAGSSDNEEWKRFKALTAGVDSVLKRTQGDLDRIKSSSYFQRKPPGPPASEGSPGKAVDSTEAPKSIPAASQKKKSKGWVGFEEGSLGIDAPAPEESEEQPTEKDETAAPVSVDELLGAEPAAATTTEDEEEEEEEDEVDDIFDTSYVDVVKLAYIPDSPVQEDEGFDPFDTSIAEKIIKEEEERTKNKKKLVSLGCAVEVLTGRLETAPTAAGKKRRVVPRRPQDVDLLLADNVPEVAEGGQEDSQSWRHDNTEQNLLDEAPEPCRSLLDDDTEVSVPVVPLEDITFQATNSGVKEDGENKENNAEEVVDLKNLVAEFDLISGGETDATPSTVKEVPILGEVDDDLEDEFAALAAESISKKPQNSQENEDVNEKDPFDTAAAAAVLGEQQSEPDQFDIERDFNPDTLSFPSQKKGSPFPISPDVDIVLASEPQPKRQWAEFEEEGEESYNPTQSLPPCPVPPQRITPLYDQEFSDSAILALAEDLDITQLDPFDTSFAENILPGKAELKLIENEILCCSDLEINEARILSRSDSDFDFNPREDETVVSTVSIQITDPTGQDREDEETGLRSLTLGHRDLLGGSTTDLSKLGHDPIQPAEQEKVTETETDPFDTSVVEVLAAPGKAELKCLEKELLGETEITLKRSISDPDFNPRAEEPEILKTDEPEIDIPDLVNVKAGVAKVVAFDVPTPSARPDLLVVGSEEGARISKPLTPYYVNAKPADIFATQNGAVDDADPFDTSFVEKLAPGKAELKIIESELVGEPEGLKHSLSDQEFNPRSQEEATSNVTTEVAANLGRRFSDFSGDRRRAPPRTLAIRGVTVTPVPLQEIPAVPTPASKPDLLFVEENAPVATKPLTPAVEIKLEYTNPFDTSIANNLLPGRAELKVLESELLSSIKRSYTDPDFNPRAEDTIKVTQSESERPTEKPDLLNLPAEVAPDTKTLTPVIENSKNPLDDSIANDIDPFDTSIASDLVPGKAELRLLESELIGQ
ncbi:hypothetical protein B7P43_G01029 [Cryptotermes secundus]|uniref:Protein stoned-A n=1 Tax=Cryptotermes secundus TaxID=105785 RepID=A0A2J7PG23_9NEOP|nr:protein stoned-A [Cryptotermes secundus]XP_023725153.1 protein stoned-A [Cryptotermes secundus]PNF15289.1 hypothetical protein B7P43_G01029 [Cryptotermes secundus]